MEPVKKLGAVRYDVRSMCLLKSLHRRNRTDRLQKDRDLYKSEIDILQERVSGGVHAFVCHDANLTRVCSCNYKQNSGTSESELFPTRPAKV